MAGRVIKGVKWSAIQQFSTQIIQFVITIILARLLLPEEFGVVAVSMIVLNILQVINETGFGAALMQKLDRDETDFFSVFVLNITMGVVLYVALYFCAPFLSILFKLPQLTGVIRLLGLNLVISSFMVVQQTKLMINVDFKTLTKATMSGAIIAGIAGIIAAYKGAGVYALVLQSLLSKFISVAAVWWMVKWRPIFKFSVRRLKALFQFAYKLILARLINVIFEEVYSSVVALFFNATQLAFFNRANSFQYITSKNIVTIVQRVSVPIMCEKQKSITDLRNVTLSFINKTSLVIIPLMVLLFVLAKPLVICLLTEKWIESAWILQIIVISGYFYNISAFNMNVFNATGRTDLALKCETIKKIISIAVIATTLLLRSFPALVWSSAICALVECMINILYTRKLLGTTLLMQFKGLVKPTLAGIAMGIIVYLLTFLTGNPYIRLFVFGIVGVLVYMAVCYSFNICDFRKLLKSSLNNKFKT